MNYHTQYRASPGPQQAAQLTNYVARGSEMVVTQSGLEASDRDIDAFERQARGAAETRQHTVSMVEEHPPDVLAERACAVADDALDGDYLVGIHGGDEDTNAHIHIAECCDERRGADFDIYAVRDALEREFADGGEPTAW